MPSSELSKQVKKLREDFPGLSVATAVNVCHGNLPNPADVNDQMLTDIWIKGDKYMRMVVDMLRVQNDRIDATIKTVQDSGYELFSLNKTIERLTEIKVMK